MDCLDWWSREERAEQVRRLGRFRRRLADIEGSVVEQAVFLTWRCPNLAARREPARTIPGNAFRGVFGRSGVCARRVLARGDGRPARRRQVPLRRAISASFSTVRQFRIVLVVASFASK
jgi:hypothetical protein